MCDNLPNIFSMEQMTRLLGRFLIALKGSKVAICLCYNKEWSSSLKLQESLILFFVKYGLISLMACRALHDFVIAIWTCVCQFNLESK